MSRHWLQNRAIELMLNGLAATQRADFGYQPSLAARPLRDSVRLVGALGARR